MRTRTRGLLTSVAIVGLCGYATAILGPQRVGARQSLSAKVDQVVVDPSIVKRILPADFLGINYTGFWDPIQGSAASARALAQTRIRMVRFPGGSPGNWYDWQQPYYDHRSSTSPLQLWQYARSLGAPHVLFQANASIKQRVPDPPGKPYASNSPANAAAWVAYDQQHGIPADMEVGNEADTALLKSKDDPAYSAYIEQFNAQAAAMHQVNRQVRVLGPVGTNEWYWRHLDGLGMFLHSTGNRTGTGAVDGISLHYYQGSNWTDSMSVPQYWLSADGPWAAIQNVIHQNDTRQLPVYMTEWNVGEKDSGNTFTPTLGHALVVTDMIGAFALSGVTGADYFDTHRSDGWGLLYGAGESRPADSPTPTYYAMALWRQMGSQVVESKQSDDAGSVMATYATTRRDGSVQVLAINKRPTAHTVKVELQGFTPANHHLRVFTLRGAQGGVSDLDARYDGVTSPSLQRPLPGPHDVGPIHGNTVSYDVPAYSAVVLDIAGASPAPGLTWPTPQAAPPAPPLTVDITGSVSHDTVKIGDVQSLTAVLQSNDDIPRALVDVEVYDDAGQQVYQGTRTIALTFGVPTTVSKGFVVPAGAWSGTYHYKVGVFGAGWAPLFNWKDDVGSFTVDGVARPEITVQSQFGGVSITPGSTVSFDATVSAAKNTLLGATVDFEVYSADGNQVWAGHTDHIDVPLNGSVQAMTAWSVPSDQTLGAYTLKIGVFGPGWKPLYAWSDNAGAFTVALPG